MKARIAEVKAKFSAYVKRASAGEEITVLDRNVPVARIVGIAQTPLTSTPPLNDEPLRTLKLPRAGSYSFDPVDSLLEDRRRDRLSR